MTRIVRHSERRSYWRGAHADRLRVSHEDGRTHVNVPNPFLGFPRERAYPAGRCQPQRFAPWFDPIGNQVVT